MKKFLLSLLLVIVFPVLLASSVQAAGELTTLNEAGLKKFISESKGKPVIVNLFATWCPPCRTEVPELAKLYQKYNKKIRIVGLSVDADDTISKIPAFKTKYGITYPLFRAGEDVVKRFKVTSIPFNVFFDKKGKLALSGSGIVDQAALEEVVNELLKAK